MYKMLQTMPVVLVICGVILGVTMVVWFNCTIHQEIQTRIGRESSNRIIPIVQAIRVTDEIPVDTVIIVVNNNV